MQRRDFIKNTVIGSGALVLGCKEKGPYTKGKYEGQIAIIGAGVAGLYAGYLLEQEGANYALFEASDQIGGRIRSLKGFADFDIELGADTIYGNRSAWYYWINELGLPFIPDNTTDFYQIATELRTESQWSADLDFRLALQLAKQARSYSGTADSTLLQHMETSNLATRVRHIPEALVANANGTSGSRLSMKGIAEENQIRSAGDTTYGLANRSFLSVLEEKCKNVIPKVILNKQIKKIDFSNDRIVLEDAQAQRVFVDKVIITVPLTVLQSNGIQFIPALPDAKLTAIKNIGMGAGMKVVLVFNRRFWEANTGSIYTSGLVPKYSVSSYGRSTQSFVWTGTVMGEKAEALGLQSSATAIQNVLKDLDSLYGKGVATAALTNARIMDWSKDPFIKGAYSYPIVGGGGLLTRQTLSQPVQRKVYFAGEATHYGGHSGTVHGAMESSRRAVDELLREVG